VLTNKYAKPTVIDEASMLNGDIDSPLRQVLTNILMNMKHIDKQSLLEKFVAAEPTSHKPKQHSRRTRNRLKHDEYHQLSPSTDNVWTIQDATLKRDNMGALQPEIKLDDNTSFFTGATDLHNPHRVTEILKNVSIGTDLSDK
jgi:hypothetical protein